MKAYMHMADETASGWVNILSVDSVREEGEPDDGYVYLAYTVTAYDPRGIIVNGHKFRYNFYNLYLNDGTNVETGKKDA